MLAGLQTNAAYFQNQPYQIIQPDGAVIDCFVSGDEYFNWLHDAEGFTIIQGEDGYFYYAISDKGNIVPSIFRVGSADPAEKGLKKWIKINREEYFLRQKALEVSDNRSGRAPHSGTMNNLVIYIKFSNDTEFTETRQTYDNLFNQETGSSVKSYFNEVSYEMLTLNSSHYPECVMTTNLSYTDSHPRSYFEPYNATTNPGGYNGDNARRLREHALLRDAINWINANSPVPAGLNIDGDNDGRVDNVSFVIRGGNGAWASLLWAHRWVLYTYDVYINGKQVWDYTFQPETQVNVYTLCHEMFHALGAPDLYHYNDGGLNISPAGAWDLMDGGSGHMGTYMKWKYTGNTWISSIPQITTSGTYTLNPITTPTNNCYKIASPYSPDEYFMVEYRQKTGTYESAIPGTGLLVYRIDPDYNGNASGPPDEVYIYRPNGTTTTNGSPSNAHFSQQTGRTTINDGTNPSSFLQNGSPGGLNIYDISSAGSTISFTVGFSNVADPSGFTATAVSVSQINLNWTRNTELNNVMLAFNTSNTFGLPANGSQYSPGSTIDGGGTVIYSGNAENFEHTGLQSGTTYYYKVWSIGNSYTYSNGVTASAATQCEVFILPFSESFTLTQFPACWSQQTAGTNTVASWNFSPTSNAGGAAGEMMLTYQNVNPGTNRLVSPAINTTGIIQLNLSFKHMLDDYGPGATLRIQSSTNGVAWTNEAWSLPTNSNSIVGPATVNTSITSNLNSPTTYVAFTVQGNLYQFDNWYIDDVSLSNAIPEYTINTFSNPSNAGTTTGGGSYPAGAQILVTAAPVAGYTFINWTENGNVVSTSANYSFMVNANRNLTANFALQEFTISASVNPTNSGSVSGTGVYAFGATANLLAAASTGYDFINWTENGNVVSTSANYSFMVNANRNLTANFALQEFTISASVNPANSGSVAGTGVYAFGATANLLATASTGYDFINWTENGNVVSTSANYSFTVNANRNLTANFALQEFTISASVNPANSGSVAGTGVYAYGATANLLAAATTGYDFINWTENGNVVSTSANYSFTVNANRNLTANFALQEFTISASVNPDNSGSVTGTGVYAFGATANLLAAATTGYDFINWTENGNVVSTSAIYSFTVNANRNLTANFALQEFTISASVNPANSGSVAGTGVYAYGATANLLAAATTGYDFINWTENGNVFATNPEISFLVTNNREFVAHFIQFFEVSAYAYPEEGGYTRGSGIYNQGETAELQAIANQNFTFIDWLENENFFSDNPVISFIVNSNRTFIARFQQVVSVDHQDFTKLRLYPNPTSGELFIESESPGKGIKSLIINGLTGNILLEIHSDQPVRKLKADLKFLSESVYFVKIKFEDGGETIRKIILKK